MEPVEVSPGRWEVRFNGAPITGCFHDTDCPSGAQICAVNETWSALPSQCTCDVLTGFGGYNCDIPGPYTKFLIAMMSLSLIVLGISFMACVYSVFLVFRMHFRDPSSRNGKQSLFNNLNVSLAFALVTLMLFITTVALILNNAIGFPTKFSLHTNQDVRFSYRFVKHQEFGIIHPMLLILSFIFSTLNMMFLCAVWASVAMSFQKLTKMQGKIIQRICVAYLVFAIAVLLPTTFLIHLWTISSIIVFIVTMLLMVAFLVTAFKLKRVLRSVREMESTAGSAVSPSSPKAEGSSKANEFGWGTMYRTLMGMYTTAAVLGSLCIVATISLGVYGLGPTRRTTMNPPVHSKFVREYAYRIAIATFALCNATVTAFLTFVIRNRDQHYQRKKAEASQGTSQALVSNNAGNPPGSST